MRLPLIAAIGRRQKAKDFNMDRIATHPGDILREEFMIPLGLSANALARALDVPPNRITSIIAKDKPRAVTPDTALRLSRYFSTTPELWLNLQQAHDLSVARAELGARIDQIVRPHAA
jgi:addiction module HigA family antidote